MDKILKRTEFFFFLKMSKKDRSCLVINTRELPSKAFITGFFVYSPLDSHAHNPFPQQTHTTLFETHILINSTTPLSLSLSAFTLSTTLTPSLCFASSGNIYITFSSILTFLYEIMCIWRKIHVCAVLLSVFLGSEFVWCL